jgi:hypothetical protein
MIREIQIRARPRSIFAIGGAENASFFGCELDVGVCGVRPIRLGRGVIVVDSFIARRGRTTSSTVDAGLTVF